MRTITDVNVFQQHVQNVLERARHHGRNVDEILPAIAGALLGCKDATDITVFEADGGPIALWVHIKGTRYALCYNSEAQAIEVRRGSTGGPCVACFTNAHSARDVNTFFNKLPPSQVAKREATGPKTVRDLILSLDRIPPRNNSDVRASTSGPILQFDEDGQPFIVTETPHSLTQNFATVQAFDLFDIDLWPGSIVQGHLLTDEKLLAPISLRRAPGTIVLTGLTFGGTAPQISRQIPEPSLSTVQQALVDFTTQQMVVGTTASVDFDIRQSFSIEHAMLQVGASASWLTGSAEATLKNASFSTRNIFLVKFTQVYYQVTFQPPTPPAAVFADEVTVAEAQKFMGSGNPPLYVATVKYGRRILLIVSSKEDSEKLNATLHAKFQFLTGGGGGDLSFEQEKILRDSEFLGFIRGGPATSAVNLVAGSDKREALRSLLQDGAAFSPQSPGVPIAFGLAYVRENAVAGVAFSSKFTERPRHRPKVQAVQYLIHTLDDDKDDSLTVNIQILQGAQILAQEAFGGGSTFHDHTDQPIRRLQLSRLVPQEQVNSFDFHLFLSGDPDDGWNMSYDLFVELEGGLSLRAGGHGRRELQDGNPGSFTDPFQVITG